MARANQITSAAAVQQWRKSRGFTFVELIICMAIITIIAGMALPMSELIVKRQKEKTLRESLQIIRNALDAYHAAAVNGDILHPKHLSSKYPPDLSILVNGADNARALGEKKVYFLRRIPRNPIFTGKATTPNSETWALRSYASPPNNPRAGSDVYDIYANSDDIGLNGVPYREW